MSSDLHHFTERLLADALMEATASYWLRRAHEFEGARSRPGDYVGDATADDIAVADARLTAIAAACRARARLAPLQVDDLEDAVPSVLAEVAS